MAKPLVTCIITGWREDRPDNMIKQMLNQTYKEKQILVVTSGMSLPTLRKKYPSCEFFDVPNRRDWAHSKRATGVCFADGEFLCFCNADDEYDPHFLEIMVDTLREEEADFTYCDWRDKTIKFAVAPSSLKKGGITSGNFMVRADIARYVGWRYREYSADWLFIRDLMTEGAHGIHVPMALMKHK